MAASTAQILTNTKITNQHNHINHINFSDNFRPHSHSFGQVSLPIKTDQKISISSSSSSRQSKVSAALYATEAPRAPRLAEMWREIQGCDDWEDLVEPLNPLLRREIIRYGEFVAASYKAFDLDPASKRYLNCKYGKKRMLRETGMESSGYEVTKYIYATPDIDVVPDQAGGSGATARWIGYVAVATDETARRLGRRDVVVTFRGTVTNPEWIANLMSSLTPARLDPHDPRPDVKVESGFLSLYTSGESSSKFGPESCREQLLSEVSRLLSEHRGEEMSLTLAGHSMGSSLANLLAYDIAELGLNRRSPSGRGEEGRGGAVPVTVFSFGGPRVGNLGFKQRCDELGVKVLRVVNVNDPITKMPGVLFNENFRVSLGGKYEFPWSCSCYAHVGVELVLDFFNVQNPSCVHDLDTYISLLKCPKRSSSPQSHHDDDQKMIRWDHNNVVNNIIGGEFFNRAKDMILSAQESFNMLPWVSAAGNMVNLVQSQRT